MGERACLKKTKNLKEKNHLVGLGAFFLVLLFFAHSLTDTHTHMPPISLSLSCARAKPGVAQQKQSGGGGRRRRVFGLSHSSKKSKRRKKQKKREKRKGKKGGSW
jgi:hypothetical protein